MDYPTLILIFGCMGFTAFVIHKVFEYKQKKLVSIQKQDTLKNKKDSSFEAQLDSLPQAIAQAEALYAEQLKIAQNTEGMTPERITAIMKPLKERLDLLHGIDKFQPVVRVGAKIADNVVKELEKGFG